MNQDASVTSVDVQPSASQLQIDCELTYELDATCDFLFMVHVAETAGQTVLEETLFTEPAVAQHIALDPASGNRMLRLQAPAGRFALTYRATLERQLPPPDPHAAEVPIADLPDTVMRFLLPTRYCESDHLGPTALELFGQLPPGRARVQAVTDWVHDNVVYRLGSSDATTTARDVFARREGVCRDYAHLAVTFCRALNIPARLVSGYARFPEPPPDFHAIFEAYLGGRWVAFDPSGMVPADDVVRIATGLDAKDVAFATIYGPARMVSMSPELRPLSGSAAAPPAVEPSAVETA